MLVKLQPPSPPPTKIAHLCIVIDRGRGKHKYVVPEDGVTWHQLCTMCHLFIVPLKVPIKSYSLGMMILLFHLLASFLLLNIWSRDVWNGYIVSAVTIP